MREIGVYVTLFALGHSTTLLLGVLTRVSVSAHGYRGGLEVASDEDELVAAFDGWHGWFCRNRGTESVTVSLRVDGEHLAIDGAK